MPTVAMQLGLFNGGRPLPGEIAIFADPQEVASREARPCAPAKTNALSVNSLSARAHHQEEFKGRKGLILDALRIAGKPQTDRQIKERLFGEAADMNMVRPRVNDLLHEGRLMLCCEIEDHVTHENVRTVWLAK